MSGTGQRTWTLATSTIRWQFRRERRRLLSKTIHPRRQTCYIRWYRTPLVDELACERDVKYGGLQKLRAPGLSVQQYHCLTRLGIEHRELEQNKRCWTAIDFDRPGVLLNHTFYAYVYRRILRYREISKNQVFHKGEVTK
jgi:hypothetical protein